MSFAFGPRQAAVSRAVCLIGSLGLATCRDELPRFEPVRLGEPRCRLPGRPRRRATRGADRDGDPAERSHPDHEPGPVRRHRVQAGPPTATDPPAVLDGEGRRSRYPAPGVVCPGPYRVAVAARPGICGSWRWHSRTGDDQEVRSRSAMALFARLVHPVGRPRPAGRRASATAASPSTPHRSRWAVNRPNPRSDKEDRLRPGSGRPAIRRPTVNRRAATDRDRADHRLDRRPAGRPAWSAGARDEAARLTSVLIMVVTDGSLITGIREDRDSRSPSATSGCRSGPTTNANWRSAG